MAQKRKQVEVDGHTFVVAPLKMGQIEELLDDVPADENYKQSRDRTLRMIHASLSNAGGNVPSLADLKHMIDLEGYAQLNSAVMEVSGLRRGEAPAAAAD